MTYTCTSPIGATDWGVVASTPHDAAVSACRRRHWHGLIVVVTLDEQGYGKEVSLRNVKRSARA